MKGRWFTKTFFNFFFGFLALIAVAFGVLLFAGSQTTPIDNIAGSQ
jgi:hypothetical protein